jgi:hypothetical protein
VKYSSLDVWYHSPLRRPAGRQRDRSKARTSSAVDLAAEESTLLCNCSFTESTGNCRVKSGMFLICRRDASPCVTQTFVALAAHRCSLLNSPRRRRGSATRDQSKGSSSFPLSSADRHHDSQASTIEVKVARKETGSLGLKRLGALPSIQE